MTRLFTLCALLVLVAGFGAGCGAAEVAEAAAFSAEEAESVVAEAQAVAGALQELTGEAQGIATDLEAEGHDIAPAARAVADKLGTTSAQATGLVERAGQAAEAAANAAEGAQALADQAGIFSSATGGLGGMLFEIVAVVCGVGLIGGAAVTRTKVKAWKAKKIHAAALKDIKPVPPDPEQDPPPVTKDTTTIDVSAPPKEA